MQGLRGPGCCHPCGQPPAAGGCVRAGGQVPSPAAARDIAGGVGDARAGPGIFQLLHGEAGRRKKAQRRFPVFSVG